MPAFIDLKGQKFGRWTVICKAGPSPRNQIRWLCECECGEHRIVGGESLRGGSSKSCGCLKDELLSKRSSGANNNNWKGGRGCTKDGYVRLNLPAHPNATKHGRVLEHVKVMSD